MHVEITVDDHNFIVRFFGYTMVDVARILIGVGVSC